MIFDLLKALTNVDTVTFWIEDISLADQSEKKIQIRDSAVQACPCHVVKLQSQSMSLLSGVQIVGVAFNVGVEPS